MNTTGDENMKTTKVDGNKTPFHTGDIKTKEIPNFSKKLYSCLVHRFK